ncbi:etoposide-induced protein 2.4-domain-containing protein [Mucor mucedo]|uniref:etoposide-induced protein 2.4-domain-containing protein n=1 Tax=Mucor mucedo TaxID=29922 RepID=UPI00222032A0|nr:etoposide-induced protein 2.4-domain-containing protein [Mucor mucedo]KAI7874280.1 etoposide-induced protein 2.4-domain-containing protein [Mucor mucedo]
MLKIAPSIHFTYFINGLKQAFNWPRVIHLITTSKTVQYTLLKSIALNGVAYLGILVLLETFYNTPDHHLFGYSYTDLTGYPLYLICLVFNSKFYAQIAQGQHQQRTSDNLDIVTTVNTIILYGNFALFISLLKSIPYIGAVVSFSIYCIIMTYYCFEYRWVNQDWTIEQRMVYAEQHWAYYLGFGLPATVITFFLSTLRAGGVYALVYPSFIMMASVAAPEPTAEVPYSSLEFALPFQIPVFLGVRFMNKCIIQVIRTVGGSRGETLVVDKHKDNLGKLV